MLHVRDHHDLVLYFQSGGERIGEFVTLLTRNLYLRHKLMQVHVKHPITFRHNGHKTLSLVRGQQQAEPTFIKTSSKPLCFGFGWQVLMVPHLGGFDISVPSVSLSDGPAVTADA